jgi:hypothetical protein
MSDNNAGSDLRDSLIAARRQNCVASRGLSLSANGLHDNQKILQTDRKAMIHGLLVDASY